MRENVYFCLTNKGAFDIITERFRQGAQKYAQKAEKMLRNAKKVLDKESRLW